MNDQIGQPLAINRRHRTTYVCTKDRYVDPAARHSTYDTRDESSSEFRGDSSGIPRVS